MNYREAKSYIRKNFTAGIYSGDNPYLTEVTVSSILRRWLDAGELSAIDYARLHYEFCIDTK